ncbi:MAG: hypothetical protein L3J13_08100, partial [Devosiaceae bacterium]|nr:hypothetical protein [Devosiaceae bacterium]
MAKKPINTKNDPASLAFSAVENALKDSILEPEVNPSSNSKSAKSHNARGDRSTSRAKSNAANRIAAQTSKVANDDKFSPSRVLYGLNAKPSGAPMWIAGILSFLWIAIIGFAAYT